METYIVTVARSGDEFRAFAYGPARAEYDGPGEPGQVIEARAEIEKCGFAFDAEAWGAATEALAAIMPEPEGREAAPDG